MNKKLKFAFYIFLTLMIIIAGLSIWYLNDYFPADEEAKSLLNGSSNVSVIQVNDGLLLDGPGNESALIFYPGAKIEYTAYLPLLMNISSEGVDCFLIEMPFNLAFFGVDKANDIICNESYYYDKWYLSGHSLGGAMASNYAHDHSDGLEGLILLASYPTDSLNLSVLSIHGSNDGVLNKESYDSSRDYMPENFTEIVIKGGNHAQFASYGIQPKDGVANISEYQQKKETINAILDFINQ